MAVKYSLRAASTALWAGMDSTKAEEVEDDEDEGMELATLDVS